MKAYSLDLRERAVKAVDKKQGTKKEIAAYLGVSYAWLKLLLKKRRETGSIAPKPHGGGHPPAFGPEKREELKAILARNPDATLEELREQTGVKCSIVAVCTTLQKMGSTRKKSRYTHRSRSGLMSSKSAPPGGKRRPE